MKGNGFIYTKEELEQLKNVNIDDLESKNLADISSHEIYNYRKSIVDK